MRYFPSKLKLYGLLAFLAFWGVAEAATDVKGYVPYPGKIQVKVRQVYAPNVVGVQFETWPGFYREFQVVLPGIEVPQDHPDVPACERKLARKAISLTRSFLARARKVYVVDMVMQDSASAAGEAPVITDRGALDQALLAEGLARRLDGASSQPWCR